MKSRVAILGAGPSGHGITSVEFVDVEVVDEE